MNSITNCPVCRVEIDISELKEGVEFDCPNCGGAAGTILLLDHGKLINITPEEDHDSRD